MLVGDKKSFWTRGEKKRGDGSGLKTGEGAREETGTEKEVGEMCNNTFCYLTDGDDEKNNEVDVEAGF